MFALIVTLKVPSAKDVILACDCPDANCLADCVDAIVPTVTTALTGQLRQAPPVAKGKGKKATLTMDVSGDGWSGFTIPETIPDATPEVIKAITDALTACCAHATVKKFLKP